MTPVFRHGRLRLYLLRLLDEEPRHGYEVIRLLRDRFMGVYAPSPGTIYPRLARLEEEGLVTHDEENGRKVYRITEAGREELRKRGSELDELEQELSASVNDIVREVKEDVRETVRTLREELTKAAREMRTATEAARSAATSARPSGGSTAPESADPGSATPGSAASKRAYSPETVSPWSEASAEDSPSPADEVPVADDRPGGPGAPGGTAGAPAGGAGTAGGDSRSARDAWEQVRQPLGSGALGSAWAQAREQARAMRDQARQHGRQAREEALGQAAQRLREEASTRLREEASTLRDIRDRFLSGQSAAYTGTSPGEERGAWHSWADWASWGDWAGRRNWPGPGPHDMAAFRDLERLARGFASEMRKVAWDSDALGGDVLANLRGILDDTLVRIKAEVFDARRRSDAPEARQDDKP
jgi:DNA-binding PadR family transcriptional regulator